MVNYHWQYILVTSHNYPPSYHHNYPLHIIITTSLHIVTTTPPPSIAPPPLLNTTPPLPTASRPAATMKAVAPTGTGTPITPSSSPPAAETHMNIHMMNDVLTNMKLVHEIAVDPEFKLIPRKRKSETLVSNIK